MTVPPPTTPAKPKAGCLIFSIVGVGIVLAIVVSNMSSNSAISTLPSAAPVPAVSPAPAAYADPSKVAVERALKDEQLTYATGGLSGLAHRGQECFDRLRTTPNYQQLDYCIAFDAYAAGQGVAEFGEAGLPADSYFSNNQSRATDALATVGGQQTDAAARIADILKLAREAASASETAPVSLAEMNDQSTDTPKVHMPSFDCTAVTSENLQLICSVDLLADDDAEMSVAYKAAASRTSNKGQLRADQLMWIKKRNNAPADVGTLHELYKERTAILRGAS